MATGVGPVAGNRCRQEDENYDGRGYPPNPPISTARPPIKSHDGGYDCEFLKRPASDLVQADCPVCLLVLREPQQVTCCGYSYCRSCIQRVKVDGKPCPTCSKEFDTFADKRLKRTLYALRVFCVHRGLGCEWEGELGELDGHLNLQPPPVKLLEGCKFSEVEYTLCLQPFQRRYLEAHQSDYCPKRPFACQHCSQHEGTFEEVTQSHWPVCPSFPLPCPNNCDLVLQRQELEQHVRNDCPLTRVHCDFHVAGCGEYLARRDMPSHISENIVGHMSHLQRYMTTHPEANMAECMGLMVGTIQKMALENAYTHSQLHEAKEELCQSHDQLRQLQESHDQLHHLQKSHDNLKESHDQLLQSHENLRKSHDHQTKILVKCSVENRQLRQAISEQGRKQQENKATVMALKDDFSHKIVTSEQNIRDQEATLTLHQQTLERITCTGELPFNFTMTEFKSKKKNDVEWYSPPFYTHTHGYRMCIRVDANGNGDGKGTRSSVYAYLMQGPYDDDLLWPFQGAITIQLLNQLEDGNHHTYTFNFNETTDPTVINRVTSGERAGSAWGTSIFLPHTQLDLNTKGNCRYLKDDQLKFRISKATNLVLTSDIHRRCLKLESFAGAIEPQVAMAPIEFTLSDFEQLKNQDSLWISPAFYTHQRGYRMCLLVLPYGFGDGRRTHVSIFTCLMRGPFDCGLKWPFRGDVTIQIVDQAGEKHHRKVVPYNNDTPDIYATRVTDMERSSGWGLNFGKFLPLTSLGYNTATHTQYLQANCLRIRITRVEIKN